MRNHEGVEKPLEDSVMDAIEPAENGRWGRGAVARPEGATVKIKGRRCRHNVVWP